MLSSLADFACWQNWQAQPALSHSTRESSGHKAQEFIAGLSLCVLSHSLFRHYRHERTSSSARLLTLFLLLLPLLLLRSRSLSFFFLQGLGVSVADPQAFGPPHHQLFY